MKEDKEISDFELLCYLEGIKIGLSLEISEKDKDELLLHLGLKQTLI